MITHTFPMLLTPLARGEPAQIAHSRGSLSLSGILCYNPIGTLDGTRETECTVRFKSEPPLKWPTVTTGLKVVI